MFSKLFKKISQHKFKAGIIFLLIIGVVYFGYKGIVKNKSTTQYAIAAVGKGMLIVSVTGSGQVSTTDQVDIKPKASGDVVYINAKNGQEVKAGTLLIQLDTGDAQKAVHDAEINLQSEQLSLDKMKGITTDEGTIRGVKEKAQDDIEKAYDDGFNTVANIFLELPDIMTGLDNILFSYDFEGNQQNIAYYANAVRNYNEEKVSQYEKDIYDKYEIAGEAYDKNFQDYKSTSRFSEPKKIESLISQTYETARYVAEAIKSASNLIQFYKSELTRRGFRVQSLSDTYLSNLNTYTGKTNTYLSNLLSIKNTIQNGKETVINTNFDIADQEIRVEEAEYNLSQAKEKLNDYYVRAPFSGVITNTADIKKGDSISASTTIATLITKQKVAEITLNEVDAVKAKTGQKTTITFDAIEGLTITGEVAEVDTLGTVSQGVVSYNIKIAFDAQDERVKSGMSLSAAVITDVKQDVLLVPNSAIKSSGDIYYVEIPNEKIVLDAAATNSGVILNTLPTQQQVQTGLANDSFTEIISGLNEGDEIITRTINSSTTATTTQQNNNFRMPGVDGGGFGR
jgi:HlyD family secretion protein